MSGLSLDTHPFNRNLSIQRIVWVLDLRVIETVFMVLFAVHLFPMAHETVI